MTLSELAEFVCEKVGQTDDDSLTLCKSFITKRYGVIWRSRLWRESLTAVSANAYSGYREVVFDTAAEVEKVVAVCRNDEGGPLMSEELLALWLTNPAAFATTGGNEGQFSILRKTPLSRGADRIATGAGNITAQGNLVSTAVTVTLTGRDNFGRTIQIQRSLPGDTELALIPTGGDTDVWLVDVWKAETDIFSWAGDNTQITLRDAGSATTIGSLRQFYTSLTQTEHPTYPRIRLAAIPTANTTIKAIGKLQCPPLTDDDAATELPGIDDALMAFAEGDMLARQRQRGKANLCYQEAGAHIQSLIDQERQQSAANLRIIPTEEVFSSESWPSKAYF